jgi:anti-sigma B factor antagonist
MRVSLEIVPSGPSQSYGLVRIGGRLDADSAESYRPQIQPLFGANPCYLVADLAELKYISSAGLNLLMYVYREARKQGGEFRLAGVQTYVKEILDLTGYTKIFTLYDTVEQATAGLSRT